MTSGATSDLKHATKQARHMIMECGMSNEIGPVYVSDEKSAETRKVIDSEISRMLREAHRRVTDMLVSCSSFLSSDSSIPGGLQSSSHQAKNNSM